MKRGVILMLLGGCATVPGPSDLEQSLRRHIKVLSSDEFEGRFPGTRGEEKTVEYLVEQFKSMGLSPGNHHDGSFIQKVPLVGITPTSASLALNGTELRRGEDYVAFTKREVAESSVAADCVFVGYGVVAPEYDWDDYKGIDVKGKTVVMLINDPPSEALFGGVAMTYYGRWTYKYEVAAARGAAACLIVHEDGPAGYPWGTVRSSWSGEKLETASDSRGMKRVAIEGWITRGTAVKALAAAGFDFEQLKASAGTKEFKPVPLGIQAVARVTTSIRTLESRNVVARAGSAEEHIIFTAHWDHLGIREPVNGDAIYNGAVDNASGTAMLLELARRFAAAPAKRTALFIAVTAEEQGLLGSKYYSEHPLYPLKLAVAAINMDGANVNGRTRDVTIVGFGNSDLDEHVKAAAAEQGRRVQGDRSPEKGFFFRSDQFSFAKVGVPALFAGSGSDFVGRPDGWGAEQGEKYTKNDYHRPSDDYRESWDLSGAIEDIDLLERVARRVAEQARYPEWAEKSEFRATREKSLRSK